MIKSAAFKIGIPRKGLRIIIVAPKNGRYWHTRAKVNGDSTIDFADETQLPLLKIPLGRVTNNELINKK